MDAHTLKPATQLAKHARTPFPRGSAEYRKAREALLAEEIEFRRHMTRLTEQRRALPLGPVIEKNYRFKDANGADLAMLHLFGTRAARHARPVRQARRAGDLLLDVRAAARAALSDVHQLARRGEWQRGRHQA